MLWGDYRLATRLDAALGRSARNNSAMRAIKIRRNGPGRSASCAKRPRLRDPGFGPVREIIDPAVSPVRRSNLLLALNLFSPPRSKSSRLRAFSPAGLGTARETGMHGEERFIAQKVGLGDASTARETSYLSSRLRTPATPILE